MSGGSHGGGARQAAGARIQAGDGAENCYANQAIGNATFVRTQ